ncbi:hypothetical protein ACHWQZ_G005220 [Mnemiopsis leidyi]
MMLRRIIPCTRNILPAPPGCSTVNQTYSVRNMSDSVPQPGKIPRPKTVNFKKKNFRFRTDLIGFTVFATGLYFVMWKLMLDCKNDDIQSKAKWKKLGIDPDKLTKSP